MVNSQIENFTPTVFFKGDNQVYCNNCAHSKEIILTDSFNSSHIPLIHLYCC